MDPLVIILDNGVEIPQIDKPQTQIVEYVHMENPSAQPIKDLQIVLKAECMLDPAAEFEETGFWPLSGKPYFHVFMGKSQLKPLYQLVVPAKVQRMLPNSRVPVVLTYCGKNWEMIYYGDSSPRRFDPSWKSFVIDNDLKVGDACLFELTEFRTKLKFRVQILRGDFPSELLERAKGETANAPIILD